MASKFITVKRRMLGYPWDKWLKKGNRFCVTYKKDYVCSTAIMTQQIRNQACKRDLKVNIIPDRSGLVVIVSK